MTPRTCRRLIAVGSVLFYTSLMTLLARHGGLLLAEWSR